MTDCVRSYCTGQATGGRASGWSDRRRKGAAVPCGRPSAGKGRATQHAGRRCRGECSRLDVFVRILSHAIPDLSSHSFLASASAHTAASLDWTLRVAGCTRHDCGI